MHAPPATRRPFLTGAWRNLVMLNYAVDPRILAARVPAGTELDFHGGQTYLSLVGFQFLDTRLLGIPIPWHRHFEELNLRFYVRRETNGELRRGVVFIKELVRRWWVAKIANWVYNENYQVHPMRHRVQTADPGLPEAEQRLEVEYHWCVSSRWNRVCARATGAPAPLTPGSHPEFIAEHYWGYCVQRDGGTVEYEVAHPSWRVWTVTDWELKCDVEALYGPEFIPFLRAHPVSAFIADGSRITVYRARRI